MVDLNVIAVAAAPAVKAVGNSDHAISGGKDWCTLGTGDVGARVGTDLTGDGVHAMAELRGDRTRNRQRPLQGACRSTGAVRMYWKVGFEIIDENDEEYIMICKL